MFYNQLFALGLTSVHFLAKEGNVLLRNEFFKFQQKIVAFPLCSVYLSYYFSDFHSSVVFVPIVIGVLRSKEKKINQITHQFVNQFQICSSTF